MSKSKEKVESQAWKFFVALGLVLLLLIGMIVYSQYKEQRERAANQYNGFDFAQAEGDLWITRIEVGPQPYDIPFYHHPRDLEDIPVDPNATAPIYARPQQLFISVDPDAPAQVVVGGVEISRLTGSRYNLFNIPTNGALSRPAAGKVDVPVFSCQNATKERVVIQFVEGRNTLVARSSNPNCIILQYTNANESVRVADRFAYMLLKIM